jgi:hypothetical protein
MGEVDTAFWWFCKYAGGGIVSFATPRILIAAGVPIDRWILAMGSTLRVRLNREFALWSATAFFGVLLYVASVILSNNHSWDPQVPEALMRMLETVRPLHVIILGLIITAAGVAWQWRTPLLPTRLSDIQAAFAEVRTTKLGEHKTPVRDFATFTQIFNTRSVVLWSDNHHQLVFIPKESRSKIIRQEEAEVDQQIGERNYGDEAEMRKLFPRKKGGCEKPPLDGVAKLWALDQAKWEPLTGCRDIYYYFHPKNVFYQDFEHGRIIGPLPSGRYDANARAKFYILYDDDTFESPTSALTTQPQPAGEK